MDVRTKIVCTLGSRDPADPALPQNAPDFVLRLAGAGMDVARLNLSHSRAWLDREGAGFAPEDAWLEAVERVNRDRAAARDLRRVAVLADLQGVKLRLSIAPEARREGWELRPGETVRLALAPGAPPPCVDGGPALAEDVRRGLAAAGKRESLVYLGDGEPLLRARSVDGAGTLEAEVVVGGNVTDRKGVTFRGVALTVETVLTEKDRFDLARFVVPRWLAGRVGVVALSFVRGPGDVRALRSFVAGLLGAAGERVEAPDPALAADAARRVAGDPALLAEYRRLLGALDGGEARASLLKFPVVAKIETREAAAAAAAIVREADGVMVARGDLGLQCEAADVPRLQKEILRAASRAGKPSIVATQMLDSMERFYEPRRPEASDVFNAVLDGADGVMLSGETSVGIYPVRAVEVLRGIVASAESFDGKPLEQHQEDLLRFYEEVREERAWRGEGAAVTDHVCYLAAVTAATLQCRALVALTTSGGTARMVARFRPRTPVYAAVHHAAVARRLNLSYGVRPVEIPWLPSGTSADEAFTAALRALRDAGALAAGERVVLLCGRPLGSGRGTNLLSVETVPA